MDLPQKKTPSQTIRSFVEWWNSEFPLDVWYRDRFGIRFNSPEHRETNLLDMRFEFEEVLFEADSREYRSRKIEKSQAYLNTGKWLSEVKPTKTSIDEAFDNLDLSKLQDNVTNPKS